MRRITATLISLLMFVVTPTSAFGWGPKGHLTIGQIAQLRLANTNTLKRIKKILLPGETLTSISIWADDVKDVKNFNKKAVNSDPDTQDFFRKDANKFNGQWHFVNLALDCSGYDDVACKSFTSPNDIVHIINLSILKLRGGNVPQLTERNALRLLVHLVGDLHQPLHVGVGFINVDNGQHQIVIERDPVRVRQNTFPSDIGGNKLVFSLNERDNLHSFWDGNLVKAASGQQSVSQFASVLNNAIPTSPNWDAQGDPTTWAAQWASDTLRVSDDRAYDNTVKVTKVVFIKSGNKTKKLYRTTRGNNYTNLNTPVVKLQLEKGGYRLAKLLQAILP